MSEATPTRRRRSDGERSRRAILRTAARLSTVEGLEGLSIARLAEASGISKGGLYALFDEKIVAKGMAAPPGRERLIALTDAFLDHLERRVFPGGCFFASTGAEF